MNNLDAASLIKAGREIKEPFQLAIQKDGEEPSVITIEKILRLLPARRIVALATQGEQKYIVKLFIGRSARRYANREISGVLAIEDAGVKTPFFEWRACLKAGGGEVVAFEYIEQASNLIEEWQKADEELKLSLMQEVIRELARLHENGVVQKDIHPGNFLFQSRRIFTIDGGKVIRRYRLRKSQSLDNLALFIAQFQGRHDNLIPDLLMIYEAARAWPKDSRRLTKLMDRVDLHRTLRKKNYIAKAFRDCTRFSCRREFKRFIVCERNFDTPALREILRNPDMAISQGQSLKNGNSATVSMIDSEMGRLVIKRYNNKDYGYLLARMFRKSRAWISWANTFRLEFLGISTLKPVALIEERIGPLRKRAYLITQYIPGDDSTALIDRKNTDTDVASIAQIINSMKVAGVSHGDLKASNFLLTDDGAVIIDLDSMKEHSRTGSCEKAQRRDRERFMRNWSLVPALEKKFAELLDSS